MSKDLIIVESPAKARTISRFLGDTFEIEASMGHIRDLPDKELGVDVTKDFKPKYLISADKRTIVKNLKVLAAKANKVYLASDHDREGEAIAWHLLEALDLDESKTLRIVFHEITKPAIIHALEHPLHIDHHLVDAQQARRVLDRLVGFELSPLLWKKVKPALSAGRVQSVAVRLIVDREEEIKSFQSDVSFRVAGEFILENNDQIVKAELNKKFKTLADAEDLLSHCRTASFTISSVETKPAKRSPAPPFTTSTLQQEASRKLGYSVSQTMRLAQQLYESGLITYMRTDSVNLSKLAIAQAKDVITDAYGENYSRARQFTTSSAGAQEAHEAIRPTDLRKSSVKANAQQMRLYELIYKRTLASQMADAKLERTTAIIDISNRPENFLAKGEVILFDGFLKVYIESRDDDDDENGKSLLPPLKPGQLLNYETIQAEERYSKAAPRYTEASLVKKLEELGIGRPSTYAPTISTIQNRGYVVKENREGEIRELQVVKLYHDKISHSHKKEKSGAEKNKLFPTDIGSLVNRFLTEYFADILDYRFTAEVEKEFDEIAEGKKVWNDVIREFYGPFHSKIEDTLKNSQRFTGERLLGIDPASGKNVYARIGRFGPMVQIGEASNTEKPLFASLRSDQSMENIRLDDALRLFALPRTVGDYEGVEMTAAVGRFGPYIRHINSFYSLAKSDDPHTITAERAIELILAKRQKDADAVINAFSEAPDIQILKGRYGPYIKQGKNNFKIPKGSDAAALSLEQVRKIIKDQDSKPKKTSRGRRRS